MKPCNRTIAIRKSVFKGIIETMQMNGLCNFMFVLNDDTCTFSVDASYLDGYNCDGNVIHVIDDSATNSFKAYSTPWS
ncbi:MAG: hypothetical protein HQK82_01090 [Desulfovibrionaceae bacterium]|nr:hypothetical protein [Desulfovibrionaceae bacterium]